MYLSSNLVRSRTRIHTHTHKCAHAHMHTHTRSRRQASSGLKWPNHSVAAVLPLTLIPVASISWPFNKQRFTDMSDLLQTGCTFGQEDMSCSNLSVNSGEPIVGSTRWTLGVSVSHTVYRSEVRTQSFRVTPNLGGFLMAFRLQLGQSEGRQSFVWNIQTNKKCRLALMYASPSNAKIKSSYNRSSLHSRHDYATSLASHVLASGDYKIRHLGATFILTCWGLQRCMEPRICTSLCQNAH